MNPATLTPALRALKVCLHLLVGGLLALACARAIVGVAPHAAEIVMAAVMTGAVYAIGSALPTVRESTTAATVWLAALTACWLGLLALSPDGAWLAFPLFFLQLHLLPRRPGLVAVVATTVAVIAGFGWHQHTVNVGTVIGPALGAAVAVATVWGYDALYRESEQRRSLIDDLVATRAELAAAERHSGTLAERERLAREIHDTLAQGLSSIVLLLRAADRALPESADSTTAREHIDRARTTAGDNLEEARRFVRALRPPDLEQGPLASALARLCDQGSDTPVMTFHCTGSPVLLPTPVEVALLRIAQSAVANAVRHSRANRVEVTLSYLDGAVAVDIVDDGVGFELGRTVSDSGFGIPAMRARAAELGGTMSVESAPGQGCAVAATFPLGVNS